MSAERPAILVVEDESIVAADLAGKLEQLGYRVAGITGTGEKAVVMAEEQRPSLVLMDIRLAGEMDGVRAADAIRRKYDVPVIFLTAHSDAATVLKAREAEAFGYILKPFDERELHTNIEMALYRHAAERRMRESEERLREAMAAGRVFSFEWEPKTDRVVRSDNCAPILGLDPATCALGTGSAHLGRVHPRDRDELMRLLKRLNPASHEYQTEYRYLRQDGVTVWLEESARADFDENGEMIRLRGIAADITDRIEAHGREKYAAALRSMTNTVNAMREGILVVRLDGLITAVNAAVSKLTGLREEEMLSKKFGKVLPRIVSEEDLEKASAVLEEIAAGRTSALEGVVFRTAVGRRSISPSIAVMPATDGSPESAVLTLRDVTELHETAELLNQIFDNTFMLIAYLDLDFNFVRVNRAYAESAGIEPDAFTGKNHFELFPNVENEAIFRSVRDTGEDFFVYEKAFEYPERPERGLTYWDWSLRPIRDTKGEMQGLLLCLVDVTERVRTREQFLKTEKRYRELVENANSIIMRVTPDLRITFFNEYAQKFFGYSAGEILGESVFGTILPETDAEGRDLRRMAERISAAPERHASNENENMRRDGSRVWVHWANRAVRDAQGCLKEILCVGTDITARKQLETEAAAYRERLRRLADYLAVAEEQDRRRVSAQIHDTVIQTLSLANIRLGGIRKSVDEAGLADEAEKLVQTRRLIDTGISECRGLMADLTPPLLYELGLGPALRDFADKQEKLHGIAIKIDEDDQPKPLGEARKGLLFQAARELVTNAIKHAEPHEVRVRLFRDGADVCLHVIDKGRGFEPEKAGLFVVSDSGGFGLFNIRERLQGLGGTLEINSAPGKGTTAAIRIPIVLDD